jgi:hypothetical protein
LATGRKRGGAYRFLKNIGVNRQALMGITGNFCRIYPERLKLIILILTWLSLGFTVWEAALASKYAVSLDSKIVNCPK